MYPLHLTPGLEASSKADFWPPGLDTSTVRMIRDNLRAGRGFRTEADFPGVMLPAKGGPPVSRMAGETVIGLLRTEPNLTLNLCPKVYVGPPLWADAVVLSPVNISRQSPCLESGFVSRAAYSPECPSRCRSGNLRPTSSAVITITNSDALLIRPPFDSFAT